VRRVTATLPDAVQQAFENFITTEFTTLDRRGQPITWPVTPYYTRGGPCIDVTTGLGYPKKADDAAANPKVALLFSDATGSGLHDAPMVLVQGTATVDDADLEANRERYQRESADKLPGAASAQPPGFLQGWFGWYYKRLYIKVRPERVYVWQRGWGEEPDLYDTHIEEVRSGHDEEPEAPPPAAVGAEPVWDSRMESFGDLYDTAVLSLVAPDGFPFSVRVPVQVDRSARRVRLRDTPPALPLLAGRACLAAHDHDEDFTWQRNFHVRGDLVEENGEWSVVPLKLVGGFELPPGSLLARMKQNFGKIRRFRKTAKKELARRGG
jgi:hypothetical protein